MLVRRTLEGRQQEGIEMELRVSLRCRFPGKYTDRDVTLLAEVDRAHERLSGPATQRILRREHEEYGKAEYVRLAGISVSHIYGKATFLETAPDLNKGCAG